MEDLDRRVLLQDRLIPIVFSFIAFYVLLIVYRVHTYVISGVCKVYTYIINFFSINSYFTCEREYSII